MSEQRAYVLIGLPGSGKSTWTEKQMKELNPRGIGVVSRDAIRLMINGSYKYVEAQQDLITDIAEESAKAILDEGYDLVIDQANISQDVRKEVTRFLRNINEDIEIHFIRLFTDGTDALVKRRMQGDARGENEGYHRSVIEKMQRKFEGVRNEEDYNFMEYIDARGVVVDAFEKKVEKEEVVVTAVEDFANEDLWSLDQTFAKFILPRLKAFRERHCSCPSIGYREGNFRSKGKYGPKLRKDLCFKHWDEILDKMIIAFELHLSHWDWDCEYNTKEYNKRWAKVEEGLSLFAKYFGSLGW